MDAMVILRTRKEPTVYGARADLFQTPILAKLLAFLKIVPMVRKRDGVRKVLQKLPSSLTAMKMLILESSNMISIPYSFQR